MLSLRKATTRVTLSHALGYRTRQGTKRQYRSGVRLSLAARLPGYETRRMIRIQMSSARATLRTVVSFGRGASAEHSVGKSVAEAQDRCCVRRS